MRRAFLLLPLLAMLVPASAHACTFVLDPEPTWREMESRARNAVHSATAIIDGQVIRPLVQGGAPALVRAHRVLKGPQQTEFLVGEGDSCDEALTTPGERRRMLLHGGPDIYYLAIDIADPRIEDRILRSNRRRDWPYVAGVEAAR